MAIALGATGYFMAVNIPITPRAVVGCVIVYNAFFGYRYSQPLSKVAYLPRNNQNSWGPIPWLYPPEIMPLTFRAKGVSLSTATNWFFNFIVGLVTPYLQEVIEWRLYPMHGFFCVCSFTVVYFCEHHCLPPESHDLISCESVPRDDGYTTRRDGRRIRRGCNQIQFLGFMFTDPQIQSRRITRVLREPRFRASLPSRRDSFWSFPNPPSA